MDQKIVYDYFRMIKRLKYGKINGSCLVLFDKKYETIIKKERNI